MAPGLAPATVAALEEIDAASIDAWVNMSAKPLLISVDKAVTSVDLNSYNIIFTIDGLKR